MKIKLNFKADQPTVNGNVYPRKVLENAFKEKFKEPIVHITRESSYKINVKDIVGRANDYEIDDDGTIKIIAEFYPKLMGDLDPDKIEFSSAGYGNLTEDKVIKEDYFLSHFFICKDEKAYMPN
jgi:hypothetical protein